MLAASPTELAEVSETRWSIPENSKTALRSTLSVIKCVSPWYNCYGWLGVKKLQQNTRKFLPSTQISNSIVLGVISPHKISPCPVATVADLCPLVVIIHLLASCVASSLVQQTFSRPVLYHLTEILFFWYPASSQQFIPCCLTSASCEPPDKAIGILFNSTVLFLRTGEDTTVESFLGFTAFFNMSGWPPVLHVTVSYGIGVDQSNSQVLFYPVQTDFFWDRLWLIDFW